jgi:ADP-ribosyl-[dinitrogen reductase] hydrolase
MVQDFVRGKSVEDVERANAAPLVAVHPVFDYTVKPRDNPSGFVVETIQAVLQALFATETFEDCVVDVVNRGGDADTTGAIAGMLAGARYGLDAIPVRWLRRLDRGVAESCRLQAEALLTLSAKGPAPERIRGD